MGRETALSDQEWESGQFRRDSAYGEERSTACWDREGRDAVRVASHVRVVFLAQGERLGIIAQDAWALQYYDDEPVSPSRRGADVRDDGGAVGSTRSFPLDVCLSEPEKYTYLSLGHIAYI